MALTGLSHLGSAQSRDAMHAKLQSGDLTDSMKMFKAGVEGGKPVGAKPGAQPEWFYKGSGRNVVACGQPLRVTGSIPIRYHTVRHTHIGWHAVSPCEAAGWEAARSPETSRYTLAVQGALPPPAYDDGARLTENVDFAA